MSEEYKVIVTNTDEEIKGEEFRSTYHLISSSFELEDFDGNTFLIQVGRFWSYHIPYREIRTNLSNYFSDQRNVDGITDCWNKGWFCCTYEKTVDILINAVDGGYKIEKLM